VGANAIEHQRGGAGDGIEGVKRTITILRSAFPDFKITIDEVAVVGDKVWARQRGGGTNLGSFAGFPPTGRKAFTDVIDICRFEDGKMVEHWGVPDQLGMMFALGHIAPPARRPVTA
jgi:predicted ester cyclase